MAERERIQELEQVLRDAPPWQALGDERYRRWYLKMQEVLGAQPGHGSGADSA